MRVFLCSWAAFAFGAGRVVFADQVVSGGVSHFGAKVTALAEGRVQFRAADGRAHSVWIDQIELLIVDRSGAFEDFNQAERFLAAGEWEKAAVRYERAMRLCGEFWPELAAARLVTVYDRAGQLDKATLHFNRTARGEFAGPPAAARLILQNIPAKRDAKFTRAIEQLDTALSQNPREPVRVLFELLRYEILRRGGDERAGGLGRTVAGLSIPAAVRSEAVYAVVAAGMRETAVVDPPASRLTALDRIIRECPDALMPTFLLLKGEALMRAAATREDWVRASWPFLRVTAHYGDDPRAADGLLGAAAALERAGRVDYGLALLEECLAHKRVSEETRRQADGMLARLRSPTPKSP